MYLQLPLKYEVFLTYNKFEENIKRFIFDYIDSVEQLEVLLFIRQNCDRICTVDEISKELRSNVSSVQSRLENLKSLGFAKNSESAGSYQYNKGTPELEDVLTKLTDAYKVRRHAVLEIIFSPLKKAKGFADSFILGGGDKKPGGSDG